MIKKNSYKTIFFIFFIFIVAICGCSLTISSDVVESHFASNALIFEFLTFILSFISGYTCVIAGIIFIALGFTGNIELFVLSTNFETKLANAGPGVVLIIIGGIIILRKKYKVKIQSKTDNKK